MVEGPNIGMGDRIDDSAWMNQRPGVGTGDGPELAEGPGTGTSDNLELDKGPVDCAGLLNWPSDGIFA